MELISVIIPVYNTEKYLKKCVDSFLNQTYSNLEIILIDDGSTDSSPLMCDKYKLQDDRIVVIHKENGGLSDARNVGIENSSGSMITFFDSDDFVDEDYIEYLYDLKTTANVQLSVCAYNITNEDGNILFTMNSGKDDLLTKEEFFKKMLNEEGITVSACFKLYDRRLFDNIRFPLGKLCEDNGTTYKVIDKIDGNIAFGNRAKCYYVIRSNSIMRSSFSLKKLDMIELTDEMCDYLDIHYPKLKDLILRRRVYARFNVLRQMDYNDHNIEKEMNSIISYILDHKSFVIFNNAVPKRDKIACLILMVSRRLFFVSWELYRKVKYDKTKH